MPLTKLQYLHYVRLSSFGVVNSRKSNAIPLEAERERSQCPLRFTKQLRKRHHNDIPVPTSSQKWYKLVRPYLFLRIYWKYTQRYSIITRRHGLTITKPLQPKIFWTCNFCLETRWKYVKQSLLCPAAIVTAFTNLGGMPRQLFALFN